MCSHIILSTNLFHLCIPYRDLRIALHVCVWRDPSCPNMFVSAMRLLEGDGSALHVLDILVGSHCELSLQFCDARVERSQPFFLA